MSSWILCEMVPRLSGRSSEARSYEPRKPISEAELWANYHGILAINSTPPNDEIVCKWCGLTVIQIMAFCLWQHQAITRTNNDLSMSGYHTNQQWLINIRLLQEPTMTYQHQAITRTNNDLSTSGYYKNQQWLINIRLLQEPTMTYQHQAITRTNNDLSTSGYYKNQQWLINIRLLQEPTMTYQHQAITRTNNDLSTSGYYKNQQWLINIRLLQEPIIRTHPHTFQWECSGHQLYKQGNQKTTLTKGKL